MTPWGHSQLGSPPNNEPEPSKVTVAKKKAEGRGDREAARRGLMDLTKWKGRSSTGSRFKTNSYKNILEVTGAIRMWAGIRRHQEITVILVGC